MQRTARGLPSTMHADDIEGSRPGWRAQQLFAQPRDHLRTDICAAAGDGNSSQRGARRRSPQQPAEDSTANGHATGNAANTNCRLGSPCMTSAPFGRSFGAPPERSPPPGLTLPPSPLLQGSPPPEHGVAFSADWRKQRLGAKLAQAEAARSARAAADAAIAAAAAAATARSSPPAAGGGAGNVGSSVSGGMGVMLKSLRSFDRDNTGRVHVSWCRWHNC